MGSPQILHTSLISFSRIVKCFTWIAHRLVSSSSQMRYASVASCRANTAPAWIWWHLWLCCNISCTNLRKGSLGINSSVYFWNWQISLKAFVPGWNLLLLAALDTALDWIWSNHLMPICSVLPFPILFPTNFPQKEWARGTPIMACFLTVALVLAIFCDEKYLK